MGHYSLGGNLHLLIQKDEEKESRPMTEAEKEAAWKALNPPKWKVFLGRAFLILFFGAIVVLMLRAAIIEFF